MMVKADGIFQKVFHGGIAEELLAKGCDLVVISANICNRMPYARLTWL